MDDDRGPPVQAAARLDLLSPGPQPRVPGRVPSRLESNAGLESAKAKRARKVQIVDQSAVHIGKSRPFENRAVRRAVGDQIDATGGRDAVAIGEQLPRA